MPNPVVMTSAVCGKLPSHLRREPQPVPVGKAHVTHRDRRGVLGHLIQASPAVPASVTVNSRARSHLGDDARGRRVRRRRSGAVVVGTHPAPTLCGHLFGRRLRQAFRADAVAEGHVGVLADVFLDAVPVVRVVANRFAIRTNRQQSCELANVAERRFELADLIGEPLPADRGCAHPHSAARAARRASIRLDEIFVGACVEPFDESACALFAVSRIR